MSEVGISGSFGSEMLTVSVNVTHSLPKQAAANTANHQKVLVEENILKDPDACEGDT